MKECNIPFCKEIPDTWKEVPNKYLFEYHSVKVGDKWKDYQLLSLTTGGVKEKDINASGGKVPDSYDKYQTVEPGDMIFCLFDLDVSAVFSGLSHHYGMITSAYDVVRPNHKILDQNFSDFWFQYVFTNRYYKMYSKNIRFTIGSDMFKAISTPIPPMDQQLKISYFLNKKTTEIDSLIEIENQQIDKLKDYKRAVITEAVTRGLDKKAPLKDSGIEWIGNIPETWVMNRLKFVASYNDESLKDDTNPEKLINYVDISSVSLEKGITNIDSFKFKDAPSRARRITNTGDIIVSTVRTYLKAIATINEESLIVSTGFCVIRPTTKMNKKYVEFWCKSNKFTDEVSRNSYGISYPAINATSLMGFWITMPPVDEQNDIVDYLDSKCCEIDALISIKQKKIDELNEYKKSLIYEYVTGKKEVC